eukprot:Lithocolla_globosa_v1_NODE_2063_length_2186_cov_5.639137.p1 type:complete len:248 gc:universal NODE_2063_length_2186_cov_5.639137:1820-1077(-)
MNNARLVIENPVRYNLAIDVLPAKEVDFEKKLGWVLADLRNKGVDMERGLIFCRTLYDVEDIHAWLFDELGDKGFEAGEHEKNCYNSIVDMFHAETPDDVKEVLGGRVMIDCSLRVLVCSIAFGMGMDPLNFSWVIHWGIPPDIDSLLQETFRVGRDFQDARATIYDVTGTKDHGRKHAMKEMRDFVDTSECRNAFIAKIYDEAQIRSCGVCDNCRLQVHDLKRKNYTSSQNEQETDNTDKNKKNKN